MRITDLNTLVTASLSDITSSVVSSSVSLESQTIISNGSTSVYTITGSYINSSDVLVFINGVSQIPITNYNVTSSTLTLNGIPASGSKIDIRRANSVLSVTFITSSMGVEYFVFKSIYSYKRSNSTS